MPFRYDLIHFFWQRCPDGYSLVEGPNRPALKEPRTILTPNLPHGGVPETVVQPNSEILETYFPMKDEPDLMRRFLEGRGGKAGALAFAVTYGLPGGEIGSIAKEMPVKSFSRFLAKAKTVLRGSKQSPARLFEIFAKAWPPNTTKFWISIDPRHAKKRQFNIIPSNLYNFIILQIAAELSGGLEWRSCQNPRCTRKFPVGRGRGTTAVKQVATIRKKCCNDSCRKAAQRARQRKRPSRTK